MTGIQSYELLQQAISAEFVIKKFLFNFSVEQVSLIVVYNALIQVYRFIIASQWRLVTVCQLTYQQPSCLNPIAVSSRKTLCAVLLCPKYIMLLQWLFTGPRHKINLVCDCSGKQAYVTAVVIFCCLSSYSVSSHYLQRQILG